MFLPPPLPPPPHRYVAISFATSAGVMAPADAVIGWMDGTTGAGMVDTFYITGERVFLFGGGGG